MRRVVAAVALVAALAPSLASAAKTQATPRDGAHDFDFDIGKWRTQTRRLRHSLAGSTEWYEMEGITVVEPVWGGKGNIATLESDGPTGHLELISLRLYNPRSHQWSLTFATSKVGVRSVPMVGEFSGGRGVFYDQEDFDGRTIWVRFTFTPISHARARSEQAFSGDGGKTWETNFINDYTRLASDRPRP